jgi:hypothetical protein
MRVLFAAFFLCSAAPAAAQYQQSLISAKDCSGTIAVAATAQTAIAAGAATRGWVIANLDTAEPLWINPTGGTAAAATPGSFPLPSGTATTFAGEGIFVSPLGIGTAAAVSVVAATLGHKYTCFTW